MGPWKIAFGIGSGLALFWLSAVAALWLARPNAPRIAEALRLLPDVLRLLKRLVADRTLSTGIRLRVGLLLSYLALPFDLVPDFIPVHGFAADAVDAALVSRSVSLRAGADALAKHWPGSSDGLAALQRLCGLPESAGPQIGDPAA